MTPNYVLVAIKYIVNESVDNGRFAYCLIAEKDDLIFKQGWDAALA
jgi:hypothetical protein